MDVPRADLAAEPGVSLALAQMRSGTLSRVSYELCLTLPAEPTAPVTGRVVVRFSVTAADEVIFDFSPALSGLRRTNVNGATVGPRLTSEHLAIPPAAIRPGENEAAFEFEADSAALNRQGDFLYSLFVPARARLVFPCFDQPDLKARFTLSLDIPADWLAVSNTPVDTVTATDGMLRVRFRETEPLPTYLFAFAAGTLAVEQASRGERMFQVWHRTHDRDLIERNLDAILDLHATSVAWLESYTDVAYPFSQFDVVLVPSFQFSGMEHPGAIFYNAERLLLESSATDHDHLTRASLIAHETAHMWFGDLVTMRWFDDVWLKEVFANFMAEKVVAEVFPGQDHDLRFFLANYPSAYAVDRSGGTHAIRQPLGNLSEAGQLYGPIIYLKAPIAFRHLEALLGEDNFREGTRRYLDAHRFGNASWDDLLRHLTGETDRSLHRWSEAWIEEAGRPTLRVETSSDTEGRLTGITCHSGDPSGRGRTWPQRIQVALGYPDRVDHVALTLREEENTVAVVGDRPSYVLAGGRGVAYASCPLDPASRGWLLDHAEDVPDALTRGVVWLTLWDELLEGAISPDTWMETAIRSLACETEGQNIEHLLAAVSRAFWLFLSAPGRDAVTSRLEACLADRLERAQTTAERASWLAALVQLTTTAAGSEWLEAVWRRQEGVPGLALGESDETTLALELAVRSVTAWDEILEVQRERIDDPERRARFTFLIPALSGDPLEREAAFARLGDRRARAREPWALTALRYLNHPLRQAHARRFIRPGLELLPEIRRTGDIFFPARWAESLLRGHASPAAAAILREFLADRPDLPSRLRGVVLIAADLLLRAGSRAGPGRGRSGGGPRSLREPSRPGATRRADR